MFLGAGCAQLGTRIVYLAAHKTSLEKRAEFFVCLLYLCAGVYGVYMAPNICLLYYTTILDLLLRVGGKEGELGRVG